ncbi:MAG: site-specific integrase, partial [Oscillospiraceae bacterium]|nr:site-specific integrase [Oscillospiraceae bacterium]
MNHHVYLRKDGRWEGRIPLGTGERGRRKYRSVYGKTREETEYKLNIAQMSVADEYAVTEMTVSELAAEWLHHAQLRLKESTVANYRMKTEKHILPAFGAALCCQLSSKNIYAFIEQKLKSGLSPRYVSDIIVLMKSMFRYASREYHIRNIMDGIILPKRQKTEPVLLDAEQQKRLKSYISANQNETTLGVALSLYIGIRIGELCALQWADIDIAKRTLTVRKTIQRVQIPNGEKRTKLVITAPKSSSSVREIPIPECLCEMLRKFTGHQDFYVLSGNNKPDEPRTMQYRFAPLLDNADLPCVHFQSLRHAFASG